MPKTTKYPLLASISYLYEEYVVKRRSLSNLARESGCALGTVRYHLKKAGINIRSIAEACAVDVRHPQLSNREYLLSLYVDEGLSCTTVAARERCSVGVVKYWLVKFGVPIRPSSHYRIGSKYSKKTRDKIAEKATGRKPTEGTRKKMRESHQGTHKGENNPAWKGGRTKLNTRLRRCRKYREWRAAVMKRDNQCCVTCGDSESALHVDHIEPWYKLLDKYEIVSVKQAEGCPGLWLVGNGRVLCITCHKQTDSFLWKANRLE